ncbi:hypothetical protein N7489_008395 [Penicillium chrysogenum]|uniref:uncharacterized protein n=1 Tax=Penicillium chrysogenum TaxID=5076 RepID=UPI0024DF21DA|nr:uncharacterized protein N7489_008395 [Penicillium chrysogenum]KAJ5227687.1 hypothetical protein N7489_008395 [Penicillium chrysogenum]
MEDTIAELRRQLEEQQSLRKEAERRQEEAEHRQDEAERTALHLQISTISTIVIFAGACGRRGPSNAHTASSQLFTHTRLPNSSNQSQIK